MSFPNVINDINELEETKVSLSELINLIYPIGSVYISVNNVSPQTFLGGTWEQIKDRFLLSAGDTYTAGNIGGEATHTLTQAETPAHTHSRGTMEIIGNIQSRPGNNGANFIDVYPSGTSSSQAFGYIQDGGAKWSGVATITSTSGTPTDIITFQASKSWTGETSSVGGNAAHNNMPPYLTVYMWKRTS